MCRDGLFGILSIIAPPRHNRKDNPTSALFKLPRGTWTDKGGTSIETPHGQCYISRNPIFIATHPRKGLFVLRLLLPRSVDDVCRSLSVRSNRHIISTSSWMIKSNVICYYLHYLLLFLLLLCLKSSTKTINTPLVAEKMWKLDTEVLQKKKKQFIIIACVSIAIIHK